MATQLTEAKRNAAAGVGATVIACLVLAALPLSGLWQLIIGLAACTAAAFVADFMFARCWSRNTRTGRLCDRTKRGIGRRCHEASHNEWLTLHDLLGALNVVLIVATLAVVYVVLTR